MFIFNVFDVCFTKSIAESYKCGMKDAQMSAVQVHDDISAFICRKNRIYFFPDRKTNENIMFIT